MRGLVLFSSSVALQELMSVSVFFFFSRRELFMVHSLGSGPRDEGFSVLISVLSRAHWEPLDSSMRGQVVLWLLGQSGLNCVPPLP